MKKPLRIFLVSAAAGMALIAGIILDVQSRYAGKIIATENAPKVSVAMVLGASVRSDGTPSGALQDRLDVGLLLYRQGKAEKILITGDDGRNRVDEIGVMRDYLLDKGLPEHLLLVDGQGYRTYESCRRAAETFDLKRAIVVTQRFHLGRALYLCNQRGIDAVGVAADLRDYERMAYFWTREALASVAAWMDINLLPPKPAV